MQAVRRYAGTQVRRKQGSRYRRYAGTQVRRYAGTQIREAGQVAGTQGSSTQVCRYPGEQ